MLWRLTRYFLILASVAALIFILNAIGSMHRGVSWVEIMVTGAVVVNLVYLLFGVVEAREPLRVLRLVSLWLDAKETELRRRGGK